MVKKLHANAASPAAKAPKKAAKGAAKSRKAADKTLSAAGMAAMVQDSALAKSVKDSAEHIWLAGMGAFSKVQAEGGKVFESLVKEGQALQRKTQAVAEETIGEVAGRMTAMAGTVQSKAGQNWDKLESIFEARTAKALTSLGVPTAKDVQALTRRVDELAQAVARLSRTGTASSAKPAATAAVKVAAKTVARKAAAKSAPAAKAAEPKRRAPRKSAAAAAAEAS